MQNEQQQAAADAAVFAISPQRRHIISSYRAYQKATSRKLLLEFMSNKTTTSDLFAVQEDNKDFSRSESTEDSEDSSSSSSALDLQIIFQDHKTKTDESGPVDRTNPADYSFLLDPDESESRRSTGDYGW